MRIISMNVTLPMTAEEAANLRAKTRAEATTPEALIRTAIEPLVAADALQPAHAGKAETPDWDRRLEDLIDTLPDLPVLSASALTRERIYAGDDGQ
jgi:hypothetical protein